MNIENVVKEATKEALADYYSEFLSKQPDQKFPYGEAEVGGKPQRVPSRAPELEVVTAKIQPNRDARYKQIKTRLYISPKGESVLQNLFEGRHNRPVQLYKALVPEILSKVGLDPSMKATWSQKAGCSCGCSPGFILQGDWNNEIFATVAAPGWEEEERKAKELEESELKESREEGDFSQFKNVETASKESKMDLENIIKQAVMEVLGKGSTNCVKCGEDLTQNGSVTAKWKGFEARGNLEGYPDGRVLAYVRGIDIEGLLFEDPDYADVDPMDVNPDVYCNKCEALQYQVDGVPWNA